MQTRPRSPNNILVKMQPDLQQNPLENIQRTQTFSKQFQQQDSPVQSRTPTMKQEFSHSFTNRNDSINIRKPIIRPVIQKPENNDNMWPLFKLQNDPFIKSFWMRRTSKDHDKRWNFDEYLFKSIMLRIGRKKKNVKGYFYRITHFGLLMYFKKESDNNPKGYLQLNILNRVTLTLQKTKRNIQIPVLYIERSSNIGISIFDHQPEQTMKLYDALKSFCLLRGFDQTYEQIETLGAGAFASVYKVRRRQDDHLFAAKTYFRQTFEDNHHKAKFVSMIYNEVQALSSVDHPSIIQLFEIFQEKDKLIIILEFCSGGTLYQYIKLKKTLSERSIAIIIKGICEALYELHRCGYVHRDLKLDNIMLESKEHLVIKLVDFGFCEIINDKELVSKSGTPGFLPPEILKNLPYTSKGDIFSVGVIIYLIIAGYAPFRASKTQQMIELNKRCQVSFDRHPWPETTQDLKYLVKKMLEAKPEDRISIAEILEAPFIIHHTRQTSETNYQTLSNLKPTFSALENERNRQQSVSFKNSKNSENSGSKHSKEFQLDFSIYTNDIKSLYLRNSIKTANSQRSQKSIMQKSSHKVIQKSIMNRESLKYQSSSVQKQGEPRSPKSQNESFGDLMRVGQKINVFEDFDALDVGQILFIRTSYKAFNKQKRR